MLKLAHKHLWKKDRIDNHFPKLDHDIEVDVLIIGGGVSGALSAYIFQEKNINVALIERGKIVNESPIGSTSPEEIDTDFKKIIPYLDEVQVMDTFSFTLEMIYKLDDMTDNLADKCEFFRNPSLNYSNQDEGTDSCDTKGDSNQFAFPLCECLSYNSGVRVNPLKLTNQLFKYCKKKGLPIYENTEVYEFKLENNGVTVVTKDKKQILCKKVLMASSYDSSLFFDKNLNWQEHRLFKKIETLKQQDKHLLTQYKYQMIEGNNAVEYHFNGLMSDKKDDILYIDEHNEYPNIYFNFGIDNKGLLYTLMGATLLSDKYLGINNKRLNMFKLYR
ncbi:FAD-dependent oxidoreductase [Mycoplasmatota bacterium]|nr:FAD-dependent oxidoreductase [Mycoplasmatota bacterium]